MAQWIKKAAKSIIPNKAIHAVRQGQRRLNQLQTIDFGSFAGVQPISDCFGWNRGNPVDRYYVELFLAEHAADISGRVLEVGDPRYTKRFGGDKVQQSDVLNLRAGEPDTTIVADLSKHDSLPPGTFDCLIMTQTLHVIYDIATALRNIYRTLKPSGVALVTVPGITKVCRDEHKQWNDSWRFTLFSARKLFEEVFSAGNVAAQSYGNVFSAVAFLEGLAHEELPKEKLNHHDPDYEVLIAIRVIKPSNA